jgi:hypothetical protein
MHPGPEVPPGPGQAFTLAGGWPLLSSFTRGMGLRACYGEPCRTDFRRRTGTGGRSNFLAELTYPCAASGPRTLRDEHILDLQASAVVPHQARAFITIELEWHLLHAFFGERLVGWAETILVAAAVVVADSPGYLDA